MYALTLRGVGFGRQRSFLSGGSGGYQEWNDGLSRLRREMIRQGGVAFGRPVPCPQQALNCGRASTAD